MVLDHQLGWLVSLDTRPHESQNLIQQPPVIPFQKHVKMHKAQRRMVRDSLKELTEASVGERVSAVEPFSNLSILPR